MPRWVYLHGFVMVKLSLILVLCLQTSWLMRVCFREKAIVILSFFLPFLEKNYLSASIIIISIIQIKNFK